MTKVTIIGEEPKEKKELKPIEFVKSLNRYCNGIMDVLASPKDFKNIELICKGYDNGKGHDLMFAYDDDRSSGVLYIGHFNDGVV